VAGCWSDGRVLTVAAYAEQVAAGDTGRWQAATRHATAWISALAPDIDLNRQLPLAQVEFQTLTLLIYALAAARGADPACVSAGEVLDWVAEHQMPMPPEADGPLKVESVRAAFSLWRLEVDAAVDRCCRDLAALLGEAGHEVPEPGSRRLDRYAPDPVISVWLTLVDTDAEAVPVGSLLDLFRPPLLVLGLTGLVDLVGLNRASPHLRVPGYRLALCGHQSRTARGRPSAHRARSAEPDRGAPMAPALAVGAGRGCR